MKRPVMKQGEHSPVSRTPDLVIRPATGLGKIHVGELWDFRDLLVRFAMRDITLRYRQTALGVVWVVAQPLMAAGIFTFVFGTVADLPSEGVPYFAFSYAGMLGWNLINSSIGKFSGSLVGNAGLVSKIFFPRLLLPLSTLGSTLLDLLVALTVMFVITAVIGIGPGGAMLILPLWLILGVLIGGGIGLISGALMVKYRDVGHVLPVLTQLLLYATPVAYSLAKVPAASRVWVELNPLTGVMVGLRWSLLHTSAPSALAMASTCAGATSFFVIGVMVFARMERQFADVI